MSSAHVEENLGIGLVDLFDCDQRRKAGADAWPKPIGPETAQEPR